MNKPNLFIVGAPKCGTTSLYEYLKQHPEIFMSPIKEPNFFNTDLERKKRLTQEEYDDLFKNAAGQKVIGEATPLYLMSKDAPKKIKEFQPNGKIIILVRKPSEVVYSAFYQNLFNAVEVIEDFEEAFEYQDKRRSGYKLPKTLTEPIERLEYDRFVDFKKDIPRWISYFGEENVLVLTIDELKQNQTITLNKIYHFLNISDKISVDSKIYNPATANKNNTIHRLIKHPPLFISKLGRVFFNDKMRSKIYKKLRNINQKEISKPQLSESLQKKLNQRYLSQIEFLESHLGINLSHWK